MKTKMDRDEETIVTQAEKILLWSAMTRDEILKKLPCAEVLHKQLPTKEDLETIEKEATGHEKKFNKDLEDIRIRAWRNRMKAALTSEARRKDWQTVRNFMKAERAKPIEANRNHRRRRRRHQPRRKGVCHRINKYSETCEHSLGQNFPESCRRHDGTVCGEVLELHCAGALSD